MVKKMGCWILLFLGSRLSADQCADWRDDWEGFSPPQDGLKSDFFGIQSVFFCDFL
jgi:hypothetical protein